MRKGFTLVELLIVVAIIGVLSTIGVPSFKRMIQKAKMAEAKVALGNAFHAETGFFTEHNTYGTNLGGMGLTVEGPASGIGGIGPNTKIYGFGFPFGGVCGPQGHRPDSASVVGIDLLKIAPNYYTGTKSIMIFPSEQGGIGGYCEPSAYTENASGGVTTYLMTASGVISPSYRAVNRQRAETDIWTIDHERKLVHLNDGTN